jgi:hypothetical protein
MEPWERVALDDLVHGPSDFRRFLWRYGSDQRRGRERFRFLAELYQSTRVQQRLTKSALKHTLDYVVDVLPDPADGRLLKEDLVSAGQSNYSIIPASDPLDVLDYFATGADRGALPPPPASAFEAIHELWSEQPARILSIAECAIRRKSTVSDHILQRLAAVAIPATFLSLSRDHPTVRERLVEANPTLLDTPALVGVTQPELNNLLGFVSDSDLARRVIGRLISADDPDAARMLMSHFPDLVDACVLEALAAWLLGRGDAVPRSWMDAVRTYSPTSLAHRLLGRVSSTNELAACATLLQLDIPAGLKASPALWAETVARAQDDISGEARQNLLAYLLSLALAQPIRGCEPLFERSSEPVHSELWSSQLPQDGFATLSRVLPDLYWWQQWDTCLRLRLGTVNAYVDANLDPKSFRRLTRDDWLFKRLIDVADDSKQGRRYLKRVGV